MSENSTSFPPDYQLRDRLGHKITRLSRVMQVRLEAVLAPHGLTRLRWCVLASLGGTGALAPSDLAIAIGITRPALSRILKTMEQDGQIERRLTQRDGRSRVVGLTTQGRALLDLCWPKVNADHLHFMDKLNPDQREALDAALHALLANEDDALDDL